MTYLLDTDTCINVLRQRLPVIDRLKEVAPVDCAISTITVYELFCGLGKAQNPLRERQKVENFISAFTQLPLDIAAAEAAAKTRIELEKQGMSIGPYDLLIAGQALAAGLTLVTGNVREFRRIAGLCVHYWS
jgi:tRNA(fMet)-specific endonuclease VapC